MKQRLVKPIYNCNDGSQLLFVKGSKSENDFIIKTNFPKRPWAHTLEYIGQALREKAEVEDINYPVEKGFQGKTYLLNFVRDCILKTETSVKELCLEYKIPTRSRDD